MNISGLVANIHWITVVVATVLSFVIGFLWHQPFLFGKTWEAENNPGHEKRKINPALIFGGTGGFHFIALACLGAVVAGKGAVRGTLIGLAVSIAWILPALAGTYFFANRRVRLLAIDAGMYVVLFAAAGAILGHW